MAALLFFFGHFLMLRKFFCKHATFSRIHDCTDKVTFAIPWATSHIHQFWPSSSCVTCNLSCSKQFVLCATIVACYTPMCEKALLSDCFVCICFVPLPHTSSQNHIHPAYLIGCVCWTVVIPSFAFFFSHILFCRSTLISWWNVTSPPVLSLFIRMAI